MTNTDTGQPDVWEPTAAIIVSGVTAIAGAIGLVVAGWMLTGPRQAGLERLGEFVVTMAAMGATLGATVIGMMAAGIGLKRARDRGVRTPPLTVTLVVNLGEFWLVFLLPAIMGRV